MDTARLATNDHDPQRDGANLQAFEPSVSLRLGEHIQGYASYTAVTDVARKWQGGQEEAFGKFTNLPGGFEFGEVSVQVLRLNEFDVLLPESEEFGEVDFSIDRSQ
ncbi:MAG: hypothetical protein AAF591_04640 [Verrucomicrobiota bacterium]